MADQIHLKDSSLLIGKNFINDQWVSSVLKETFDVYGLFQLSSWAMSCTETDTRLLCRPAIGLKLDHALNQHLMVHKLPSMLLRQHSQKGVCSLIERVLVYFAVGMN